MYTKHDLLEEIERRAIEREVSSRNIRTLTDKELQKELDKLLTIPPLP